MQTEYCTLQSYTVLTRQFRSYHRNFPFTLQLTVFCDIPMSSNRLVPSQSVLVVSHLIWEAGRADDGLPVWVEDEPLVWEGGIEEEDPAAPHQPLEQAPRPAPQQPTLKPVLLKSQRRLLPEMKTWPISFYSCLFIIICQFSVFVLHSSSFCQRLLSAYVSLLCLCRLVPVFVYLLPCFSLFISGSVSIVSLCNPWPVFFLLFPAVSLLRTLSLF